FYDKAYKQIDDKEVRRNDEYYQAYNRRDLRTGKFGVKLSDVQFDLEKKMQSLKERKELVKQLKSHFDNSEALYTKSQFLFKDLRLRYGAQKTLFLRSNEQTTTDLKRISTTFDSCILAFKNYKSVSEKMGKTSYNQELVLKEITNFESEGDSPADFMNDKVELWDYSRWSSSCVQGIEKEIIPMRDNLIAYDIEINKLRDKLNTDSVSVRNDLTKLIDKILYDQLKKYDPDPMPMDVFGMKIAELEYLSELINYKQFKDSANVQLHISLVQKQLGEIEKLDSLASKLNTRDFEAEAKDYNHFITNAYGTPAVLKSLVKTTKDFAGREKIRKADELSTLNESLRWMLTETDSIPLFMEVSDA
ncbi:MAG: hypothetical protein RIA63_11380, partial [Cyclobacteriaceae bacterium]